MNTRTKRLAHAYAVRELCRLGDALTSGRWTNLTVDRITAPEAAVVIARALGAVVDVGLGRVREALDDKLRDLLGT